MKVIKVKARAASLSEVFGVDSDQREYEEDDLGCHHVPDSARIAHRNVNPRQMLIDAWAMKGISGILRKVSQCAWRDDER